MPGFRLTCVASVILFAASMTNAAEVVAIAGRPFGVGRITVSLAGADENLIVETNGYTLEEAQGRVFYPTFGHRRVLGILRELIGVETRTGPSSLTVHFLFRGDEPLQLKLRTPDPQTIVAVPQYSPRQFQRLQRSWWQQYAAMTRLQEQEGDYPPLVEVYLARMLGQRLGLRTPLLDRVDKQRSVPQESLLLVLNLESMRMQTFEDTLRDQVDLGAADLPVPEPIAWTIRDEPEVTGDVTIEPIAMHVPEECFYLRFGSFQNYLWLRKFTEQNGGSVSRLVTSRGHDALLNQRLQRQLCLKETALAELFGNQLISDVVILGRDTYMREGAAIGILFEARNGLLKNELSKQQRAAADELKPAGASISAITVAGRPVSVASTPDNELRSFYVIDDRYHLVTNSLMIVQRFLESGQGRDALGQSDDFRRARSNFAIDPQDTLFAYLSPAFFRGLVSPQYQIEIRRRLRAVTDLEIVGLAQRVAIHEQRPHESIDDLIASGLLPAHFNQRPDGSYVVLTAEGASDSLRGKRGNFLPIPDVTLEGATLDEAERFAAMTRFHQQRWSDMDPLVLQVKRTPLAENDRERLDIRAEMLPFDRRKYGLATSVIGPPSPIAIRQSADDAITAQLAFQGGLLNPNVEPHQLFFGIRDEELPIEFSTVSLVRIMQVLRTAPAYLGSWPALGFLDLIPLRVAPVPDENGLTRLPFGLWQMSTVDGFSLVGVDPHVLATAASELAVEEVDAEAQLRVHVTDVSQSKIKTWFAALDFQRAYRTSIGNTRLLHTIAQQLGVPQDQAREAAEEILGVQLICALGGDYKLYDGPNELSYWGSSNWPSLKTDTSDGAKFASPSMAWFRGLDAQIRLLDDRISAEATLEIQKLEGEQPKLPFFDLLRRK